MPKALTYQTIKEKTYKTLLTEHIQNSARGTNVTSNPTQHIQNIAQTTNVPNNQTEHIQNGVQCTNLPNSHTEHIQNGVQNTHVTKILQNTFKTVRKALTYQTVKQST